MFNIYGKNFLFMEKSSGQGSLCKPFLFSIMSRIGGVADRKGRVCGRTTDADKRSKTQIYIYLH